MNSGSRGTDDEHANRDIKKGKHKGDDKKGVKK